MNKQELEKLRDLLDDFINKIANKWNRTSTSWAIVLDTKRIVETEIFFKENE